MRREEAACALLLERGASPFAVADDRNALVMMLTSHRSPNYHHLHTTEKKLRT
jgi:hypothetical protein